MEKSQLVSMDMDEHHSLSIVTAGISHTYSGHTFGPAIRPYYLIHYILSGKGKFIAEGVSYELSEKQGFLISPGIETTYIADDNTPWSYVWIGFNGSIAAELVGDTGLSLIEPIFSSSHTIEIKNAVLSILNGDRTTNAGRFASTARLYDFLGYIASADKSYLASTVTDEYIYKAIGYIREHIDSNITVQTLADFIGLERSWFTARFQKAVGTSPGRYIQLVRLTLARHTLESTHISLDEIAARCGYKSAEALSKAFRRQFGVAPGKYRQETHK